MSRPLDLRCLRDLDEILAAVFDRAAGRLQPRCVLATGSLREELLQRIQRTVQDRTIRGRMLDRHPLALVEVRPAGAPSPPSDPSSPVRRVVLQGDPSNPRALARELSRQGIAETESILCLGPFLSGSGPGACARTDRGDLRNWLSSTNGHGLVSLDECEAGEEEEEGAAGPAAWLAAAARDGLFPKAGFSRCYVEEEGPRRTALNWLEKRPYRIRFARGEDLSELASIEKECWPEGLRAEPGEMLRRMERFPRGQCVLEIQGSLAGVVYSQRIADPDAVYGCTDRDAGRLRVPGGPFVQLLAINVDPAWQDRGLGDELLEFMLQYCGALEGVKGVVAVSLCSGYRNHSRLSVEEYIRRRDGEGRLLDPTLHFHEHHGARIRGTVPGYRPGDGANFGHGVLVEYDPATRRAPGAPRPRTTVGETDVPRVVEECIRSVAARRSAKGFSLDLPLREAGLDSLNLLELRSLFARRLGVEVEPSFFFRHATARAIMDWLASNANDAAPPPSRKPEAGTEAPASSGGTPSFRGAPPLSGDPDSRRSSRGEIETAPKGKGSPEAPPTEPVAIIGMSCRFPGGAKDPESYWELLERGGDGIVEIPASRWDADRHHHPDPGRAGATVSRHGGFIENIDGFDADFFRISPREAALVDPQQRLLLETGREALERAGIAPESLAGSLTGVFVGYFTHDYELLQLRNDRGLDLDAYFATGTSPSVAAGRLAYTFGLRGPALSVNTACSSSLVAVHLACRSLRSGECRLALAAGVNLILSPELSVAFSRAGMLSPSGRCRTFDARADGYARSEGCGTVALKPLSQALEDGDPVLAVIRSSAINQDGASNGLTAPNPDAQEEVIRRCLEQAGASPEQVAYIEAHGTGTSLGDPVEVEALARVFAGRSTPLALGSVKTNIGHAEAAAGIAGLMKIVLSMQRGFIPPHLHFEAPSPLIDLEAIPATVPARGMKWPEGLDFAGVSSFGFSGTNAHVLLERFDEEKMAKGEGQGRKKAEWDLPGEGMRAPTLHLLALSAKTDRALEQWARSHAIHFRQSPGISPADACLTANTGRTHFERRLAVWGESAEELADRLEDCLVEEESGGWVRGIVDSPRHGPAFLFTGQGSQHPGMGREFYETQPAFRRALDECAELLEPHLEHPLLDAIFPSDEATARLLDETACTQPALFAVEYALARMWMSWGVEPSAVMGHSVGEYVAACLAGIFGLEDGLKLIAARGRLMQSLPEGGAMAAFFCDEARVRPLLEPFPGRLALAAVNGPEATVASGERGAVEAVVEVLEAEGVQVHRLSVSHAFHSPLVEPILGDLETVAREVEYRKPSIPFVSNVTGDFAWEEPADAAYWVRHARLPVLFGAGMEALFREGREIFVEAGPKPVLLGMGRRCVPEDRGVWLPTMRPGLEWPQTLSSLGRLYACGITPDWKAFHQGREGRRILLPTYPFQRKRYWIPLREEGPAELPSPDPSIRERPEWKDWLFRVDWRLADGREPAQVLPDPRITARKLTGAKLLDPDSCLEHGSRPLDSCSLAARLENLGLRYILQAAESMGGFPAEEPFSTAAVADRWGVKQKHSRLLERLLGILGEAGALRGDEGGWATGPLPTPSDPEEDWRRLMNEYPEASTELTLLGRCGKALAAVLRGKQSPLRLIFPEGDSTVASDLYRNAPAFAGTNRILEGAMAALVESLPQGRPLKVLEIGAGTGGATAHALSSLPPQETRYVFTDISPWLLSRARRQFRDHPFMSYKKLDIERDPLSQGFREGEFDVVLAAHVLHATEDLRKTLEHVGRLLVPGGWVMILEGVAPRRWIDLIFGMIEGWWRFKDRDLRPSHPLPSPRRWEKILGESGLGGGLAMVVPAPPEQFGQDETVASSVLSEAIFPQAVFLAQTGENGSRARSHEPSTPSGQWLVAGGAGRTADRLAAVLGEAGENLRRVRVGDDLRRAIASGNADGQPPKGLLYVQETGLAGPTEEERDERVPVHASIPSLEEVVQLLRDLSDNGFPSLSSVWLATTAAQPVEDGEIVSPVASALWGLGKVAALEHPELSVRLVDLGPEPSDEDLRAFCRDLRSESPRPENQLAFRRGKRYVPRLTKAGHRAPASGSRRIEGTVLVTGGLGGIGLEMAKWLVTKRGARHLALLGRREPSEKAWRVIEDLRDLGASVVPLQADVRDLDQLESALDSLVGEGLPPLGSVFHLAGILREAPLSDCRWGQLEEVLAPKAYGAWNLHKLAKRMGLKGFVMMSSVFSVFGSPSLAGYAAANAFLDGLAHYRRSLGLPAVSINWGPWREAGMLRTEAKALEAQSRAQGLTPMDTRQALRALEGILEMDPPQTVVVPPLHWTAFSRQFPSGAAPPFFDELAIAEGPTEDAKRAESDLLERVASASASQAREAVLAHVKSRVASILGFDSSHPLDIGKGFFELGMDSLTSVELRNRLQRDLNRGLPLTVAFRYPSIQRLADHLFTDVLGLDETASAEDSSHRAGPVEDASREAQGPEMDTDGLDPSIVEELTQLETLLNLD